MRKPTARYLCYRGQQMVAASREQSRRSENERKAERVHEWLFSEVEPDYSDVSSALVKVHHEISQGEVVNDHVETEAQGEVRNSVDTEAPGEVSEDQVETESQGEVRNSVDTEAQGEVSEDQVETEAQDEVRNS